MYLHSFNHLNSQYFFESICILPVKIYFTISLIISISFIFLRQQWIFELRYYWSGIYKLTISFIF